MHSLEGWLTSIGPRALDASSWERRCPLVIINGCHTCNLEPGQILSFASAFGSAGASGVIGTEVSVILPVAVEVAESVFRQLSTTPLGETIRAVRWELANKGNLAGLAYTAYSLADLQVTSLPGPNRCRE